MVSGWDNWGDQQNTNGQQWNQLVSGLAVHVSYSNMMFIR